MIILLGVTRCCVQKRLVLTQATAANLELCQVERSSRSGTSSPTLASRAALLHDLSGMQRTGWSMQNTLLWVNAWLAM